MPRTNPFSKLWLVFSLQIITCFGLPVWSTNTLETGLFSPCTPIKLIIVDDNVRKDNELIIPYSICQVDRPTCFISKQFICDSPIQGAETIQEAQFVDKNGKVNHVPHDNRTFNVSLKGEHFTTQSIYNYTVSYYYETICNDDDDFRLTFCSGWINTSLMILVTDVRLTVVSDEVLTSENDSLESDSEAAMTQKRFQVEGASVVDLECSLGLTDLEHLNMQLEFVFTPADSNATKMVPCNSESIQRVDNWVVTPNMNSNACHLKIMNFSKADGGQYDCLMVLNNSHTSYNQDKSNAIFLAIKNPKNQDRKLLYYVIPSSIAAIVILCLVIFVIVKIRKKLKHHPRPDVPALVVGPIPHEGDYGSTGSTYAVQCHRAISGEIVNPGQDTPYSTGTETETSFSEHDTGTRPPTLGPLPSSDSPRPTSSSDDNLKLNAPRKQPSSSRRSRPRSSQKRSSSARSRRRIFSHPRPSCIRRQNDTGTVSEIISHDRNTAMEHRNGLSTRIAPSTSLDFYSSRLVGYEIEEGPQDTHGGSRPDGSQPNLTNISQIHPQQDQAEAGGAVPTVLYRHIPSDTTSSTGPYSSASSGPGATSESSSGPSSSDLSAGETPPQSHCRLEQRDGSCSCSDNEPDNNNSGNNDCV